MARSSAKATVQRLFTASSVRNKIRRQALFQQERLRQNKEKRAGRERRQKEREKLGDKVGPVLLSLRISTQIHTILLQ